MTFDPEGALVGRALDSDDDWGGSALGEAALVGGVSLSDCSR